MKKINSILLAALLLCFCGQLTAQNKLSLSECTQLALKNNAKSRNSKLEMEASKQVRESAYTNYFPSVSAGGMTWYANEGLMETNTQGGNLPVYDGNPANLLHPTQFAYFPSMSTSLMKKGLVGFLNVIQPLYAGGRITTGNELAALGEEVSVMKDRLSSDEIIRKTEEQYWMIVSLDEKNRTIDKYEELLNRILFQVEDAYKAGVAMKNDVLRVKLKLSEIRLNRSKLNNGRKLALMAFCQHIGMAYDSTIALADTLKHAVPPQNYRIDNNEALRNRTEYSLLEKSVEAEKLQTELKRGEYLPQAAVGLSGMYMKTDEADGRALGLIFGTVSVPISNWWGGSYELEERKLKEKIAENSLRDNSELLILQMQKAWQDLSDTYDQYLLNLESKAQAEENLRVNEDGYKSGIITLSDLLEAQALLQQTQDQITETNAKYLVTLSAYLKVTGR